MDGAFSSQPSAFSQSEVLFVFAESWLLIALALIGLTCFRMKIPPDLPFQKGGIFSLFEKEGLGEIF